MMADTYLTDAELHQLTGYAQPSRQCAWLKSRGWVFEPPARRGERPKVARAYHDARMSGQPVQGKPRARPTTSWMTQPA